MSPELETLDQLHGGDLKLEIVAKLYPSQEAFECGVLGLLSCRDVRLLNCDGEEVPEWQWKELLARRHLFHQLKLGITTQGAKRIG